MPYPKSIYIYVVWPRHWLNQCRLKVTRSQFAAVEEGAGGPVHTGECFTAETRFGKIAIPLACVRSTVL